LLPARNGPAEDSAPGPHPAARGARRREEVGSGVAVAAEGEGVMVEEITVRFAAVARLLARGYAHIQFKRVTRVARGKRLPTLRVGKPAPRGVVRLRLRVRDRTCWTHFAQRTG